MMMAVRLIQAVWRIARCKECASRAYDLMKVEEKRGGLTARAVIFSKPCCRKRAKLYESAGASNCLEPCKLHAKSLAICEYREFLSHCLQYPGTRYLHMNNCSLLYQFSWT